jgi:predicted RNase H-like HicB family nuclease
MPPPRNPADRYTYRLFWSSVDDCFVGTCVEFPSLSHLADTDRSALMGIRNLVAAVLRDLKRSKSHIPAPAFSQPRLVGLNDRPFLT